MTKRKPRVQKDEGLRIERVFDGEDDEALFRFLLGIYEWGEQQRLRRAATRAADAGEGDLDSHWSGGIVRERD